MSPNLVMAKGPFGLSNPFSSSSPAEAEATAKENDNQVVAEQIAVALRQAKLTGYDISIEYQDGVATLSGMIQDDQQKQKAREVVQALPAVKSVDNKLGLINPTANKAIQQTAFQAPVPQAAPVAQPSGIEQAGFQAPTQKPVASPIQQVAATKPADDKARNQEVANRIAYALRDSGVSGYDIEISYKSGVANLSGVVGNDQQRQYINSVVSQVPDVASVNNQLQVAQAAPPVMQTAYQPTLVPGEAAPNQAPMPPAMAPRMAPPAPAPVGPGPVYGHAGPGPVNPVYNQPYLPEHAWPTTAAYPNSAAISYPTQYSASAFPYVGPFYPYPQVPLGWRSSTLEWDDGQWQLKFSPQTERWWWFMNPKNWD
ncbi:BON domain-containing protein [uncultured Rubinisphaera sp.]|uniref:BON domain-containing protein n=1 Tax=uncultured Rubinisphaera sp. TaxID=1678686 RepID=UPI0030DA8979